MPALLSRADAETECPPFITDWLKVLHFVSGAIGLLLVVIYQYSKIAEAVFAGAHGAFPDRTFVGLAVADDHEGSVVRVFVLGVQGEAYTDR